MKSPSPTRSLGLAPLLLLVAAALAAAEPPQRLPVASCRDVPAKGRLFQRGIPVTQESFSPDGYHFAYLHVIPGGILRRRPQRCAFLLDLATGENRPVEAPRGPANRLGGWDPTGRYLLIESVDHGFLSSLTGSFTTYHWIYDVVTSEFIARRPFTGMRDGQRFRWKIGKTYHGAWSGEKVWPLYQGELAEIHQRRSERLRREDERRRDVADRLGLGSDGAPEGSLTSYLPRLDEHWTQRGHRDPVVSDLFGERPVLFWQTGDETWEAVHRETEYVAVLDHGLVLVTGQGGAQSVFFPERWELLLLPPVPPGFVERLETRWDRSGGFYDENDPLPRDLQYRRSSDPHRGQAQYFNYVTPDRRRLLVLYSMGPESRVLRVVDLPESWQRAEPVPADAAGRDGA